MTASESKVESLKTRALRSSGSVLLGFGGANLLRLASNLVLTRLLFPEAFGLMALVQVFLVGFATFSDIGITTSIITSPRGEEKKFLNTAWTLQVIRGVVLWVFACLIAYPLASLYDEPMLVPLLQVMGISLVVRGFFSTNGPTAGRNLAYGRLTILELISQLVGAIAMIAAAYVYQSVWSLVVGTLLGGLVHTVLSHKALPGIKNEFAWDWECFGEIFHFGKYLFFSTLAGFFVKQGDRAILGAYISLSLLGVYNIGMFLGTAPLLLGQRAFSSLIVPLYRMRPPAESDSNRKNLRRARRMLIASLLAMTAPLMFGGVALVDFLYDDRYTQAGAIVVLFAVATAPVLISEDYGNALLANQDSKNLLVLTVITSTIHILFLFIGIGIFGVVGAVIAPAVAALITYPLRAYYANRYKAWDPVADGLFFACYFAVGGAAVWMHWPEISALITAGRT